MAVDKPAGADTAHAPAQPGKWRLGGALWLLGMPGVVAVVWALLPTLKVNEALLPLPLEAVLLLSGLQTAVLLALAVALGVWLAPRVGLQAPAVSAWLAGWIIGAELDPVAIDETDRANQDYPEFSGTYFVSASDTGQTTPTERWLAERMDYLATAEAGRGRSSPIAFVNWPTTDPLEHPAEPIDIEDLVGIDANHVRPTAAWPGGSFASYHAYPYYPDFLRY